MGIGDNVFGKEKEKTMHEWCVNVNISFWDKKNVSCIHDITAYNLNEYSPVPALHIIYIC